MGEPKKECGCGLLISKEEFSDLTAFQGKRTCYLCYKCHYLQELHDSGKNKK